MQLPEGLLGNQPHSRQMEANQRRCLVFSDHGDYKEALDGLSDKKLINEYCFCRDAITLCDESCPDNDWPTMLSMCVQVLCSRRISINHRGWEFVDA